MRGARPAWGSTVRRSGPSASDAQAQESEHGHPRRSPPALDPRQRHLLRAGHVPAEAQKLGERSHDAGGAAEGCTAMLVPASGSRRGWPRGWPLAP